MNVHDERKPPENQEESVEPADLREDPNDPSGEDRLIEPTSPHNM